MTFQKSQLDNYKNRFVEYANSAPLAFQDLPQGFRSMDQVKSFISGQVLRFGDTFAYSGNGQTNRNIQLPKARMLLGLVVYDNSGDPNNSVTLQVDSENKITRVPTILLSKFFGAGAVFVNVAAATGAGQEWFEINHPMNGNNQITLQIQAISAGSLSSCFYYLPAAGV